jgi:hypothetical protein
MLSAQVKFPVNTRLTTHSTGALDSISFIVVFFGLVECFSLASG